jgi:hypothetical protein
MLGAATSAKMRRRELAMDKGTCRWAQAETNGVPQPELSQKLTTRRPGVCSCVRAPFPALCAWCRHILGWTVCSADWSVGHVDVLAGRERRKALTRKNAQRLCREASVLARSMEGYRADRG